MKLIHFTKISIAIFILIDAPSQAISKPQPSIFYKLSRKVDQTVQFTRLKDGKVLYKINPTKSLSPASVTKLVTSAAAFDAYGSHHQFETVFSYSGKRKNQAIMGDLHIKGAGDPLIISELMWQLATDLKHKGIRTIRGNIIIDNSRFDSEIRDKSREKAAFASRNAYDAPITAFGVNYNTYTVAVAPSTTIGNKAHVNLDPYSIRVINLKNQVLTAKSGRGERVKTSRMTSKTNRTTVDVRGSIAKDRPVKKVYRSVADPVLAAGEQVRAFLAGEGIIVQGAVREGKPRSQTTHLITLTGYPLYRVMSSMNKYSSNYIADVMLKNLSVKSGITPGSLRGGVNALNNFLRDKVKLSTNYKLLNGSGLEPKNRLSASQVVELLRYMEKSFEYFPEFLASLPASNEDGTLKDRFKSKKSQSLKGIIRAKTGTLTQPITVSAIAGYLRHKKHGLVAFAIIENGRLGKKQPNLLDLRDRQDKAIAKFINQI